MSVCDTAIAAQKISHVFENAAPKATGPIEHSAVSV